MPFIPNELDAFHPSQASPDSGDLEVLRDGAKATGVVSGGEVTAQGTPDMTVAVATGVIAVEGAKVNVAAGNVTITAADGTDPRIDLIVVSSAGAKSAVAGTPAPEMDPPTEAGPAYPAIPASSVVLASVYVPAADTTIAQNQITDKRVFVVPPEPTTNYDLAKALSIPLVKERSQTVTLDTGQNFVHALIMAQGKLFAVTQTNPAILIRFNNPEDLTDRTVHTYAADGQHNRGEQLVYVPDKGKIYLLFGVTGRTVVSEIDPSTLAVTDVINTAAENSGDNGAMCSDGTHLYIVTYTSPSKILKYALSDFSLTTSVSLTGRNNGHAMVYDQDRLYAAGNLTPPWIAKINPADLTFTDAVITSGFQSSDEIASVGDHIWFGGEQPSVLNLLRIDKETLAVQELIFTEPLPVYSLFFDGEWLWVAHNATPGKLSRVDPGSGQTWTHTFPSGFNDPNEIASDGQRLFITTYTSPSQVMRLASPKLAFPRLSGGTQVQMGGSLTVGTLVGVRNVEHAVDGNVGSSEETLLSAALTANTLSADKKALRVTATGRFAANANAKRILLKFGLGSPVTVFDTGSLLFNDAQWWLDAICVRAGANDQDWVVKWTSDSYLLATKVTHTDTTQTDTAAINILVRGVGVSANDTTNEFLLVEMVN